MRIDDALGSAGGAARVAHRDRIGLRVRRVVEIIRIPGCQEVLVVREFPGHRRTRIRKYHHLLEGMQRGELTVERQQDVIDDQHAIGRMMGNPADIGGRQSQVQRVQDAARGGDAEERLEMGVVVPAQRRDTLAFLQSETLQCRSQRARTPVPRAVGVAPQTSCPAGA